MFEFPTNPSHDYPSPASCKYSFFNEDCSHAQAINNENLQSTRPFYDPGCGDPTNEVPLDLKNIVNQNIRGWDSSRKIEAVIELMICKDIRAMTVQETWKSAFSITSQYLSLPLEGNNNKTARRCTKRSCNNSLPRIC
jgi:hypothetical protein